MLRRFSLDEIPNVINVLRGEMSLVGPRPLPLRDYARLEPWHRRRSNVLPGMTGLWQIAGRSDLTFDDLVRLDFYYLENWSLWLDITILVRTIPAVLGRARRLLAVGLAPEPAADAGPPGGLLGCDGDLGSGLLEMVERLGLGDRQEQRHVVGEDLADLLGRDVARRPRRPNRTASPSKMSAVSSPVTSWTEPISSPPEANTCQPFSIASQETGSVMPGTVPRIGDPSNFAARPLLDPKGLCLAPDVSRSARADFQAFCRRCRARAAGCDTFVCIAWHRTRPGEACAARDMGATGRSAPAGRPPLADAPRVAG